MASHRIRFTPGQASFGSYAIPFQQTTITRVDGRTVGDLHADSGSSGRMRPKRAESASRRLPWLRWTPARPVFTALTGQVGTTVTPGYRIRVVTTITNQPIPNVALYFWNGTPDVPRYGGDRSCRGVPADVNPTRGTNVVLTDNTGEAVCNPVLGGLPNVDGVGALTIGGSLASDTSNFISGYRRFELNMRFTPGAPGQIRQVSGNNQTAQAGQALASPLVVEVLTASGGAMAGQAVNWTVSPAAGGNLGSAQTTTDSSGRTSNTLRFPTSATGPVVVTATLATDTTKTTTFTATAAPLITVTSMSIVSGNSQNAILNTSFSPLVVQVNSTAGPASGVAVASRLPVRERCRLRRPLRARTAARR